MHESRNIKSTKPNGYPVKKLAAGDDFQKTLYFKGFFAFYIGLEDSRDHCAAICLNISSFSIKAFPNSLAPVTLKCVSSTNKRVPITYNIFRTF
jgi:hypothetical protein